MIKKQKSINKELFKKHLKYQNLSDMLKYWCNTKDTKRNKIQVDLIKSGLVYLNNEIEKMSKNKFENEQ